MTELESQIKIYNKKRGICKAKLTNFTKFVRGLQDEILNLNYKVNPAKLAELETRLEIVVAQVLTEFDEYQQFLEQNHENQDEQLTNVSSLKIIIMKLLVSQNRFCQSL